MNDEDRHAKQRKRKERARLIADAEEEMQRSDMHELSEQIPRIEGKLKATAREKARIMSCEWLEEDDKRKRLARLDEHVRDMEQFLQRITWDLHHMITKWTLGNRHRWDPVPHPPPHE